MTPKEERLLAYLKKNKKGITSLDAINKLGETRLSATIYLLRQRGIQILDTYETSQNRYGEDTRFKRYVLSETKGR
ncbi:MAG: helix-turn-helix domain-containing protein [Candidatus Enterosoma sp.]|nr:helix-turn-helix domain-containing protein [Candidatus Enterosoma sp.]